MCVGGGGVKCGETSGETDVRVAARRLFCLSLLVDVGAAMAKQRALVKTPSAEEDIGGLDGLEGQQWTSPSQAGVGAVPKTPPPPRSAVATPGKLKRSISFGKISVSHSDSTP